MKKRFGLIGENIAYTLSPPIHEAFYRATGIDAEFVVIDVPQTQFQTRVPQLLREMNGFNVTKPYKQQITAFLCGEMPHAVNTVIIKDTFAHGINTDGAGFGLATANIDFGGRDVLIAGAGGAAAAISENVLLRGGRLWVANRTRSRAEELIAALGSGELFEGGEPEIFVNCTTLGRGGENSFPENAGLGRLRFVYETAYTDTPLLKMARSNGIACRDGFGMLFFQAVLAECAFNEIEYSDALAEKVRQYLPDNISKEMPI